MLVGVLRVVLRGPLWNDWGACENLEKTNVFVCVLSIWRSLVAHWGSLGGLGAPWGIPGRSSRILGVLGGPLEGPWGPHSRKH